MLSSENASVVVPVLANVLRTALTDSEGPVLIAASGLLGRLAATRGFLIISETVQFELKRALERLNDSFEFRRLSSVLVLKELSQAVPAAIFQQLDRYFNAMWPTLCDAHRPINKAAALTLRRLLDIVLRRGPSRALSIFSKVLSEALPGLTKVQATTHGSLLAVAEVFGFEAPPSADLQTFLVEKFPFYCDAVLKLRSAKDQRIAKTVMELLPRLARFQPNVFSSHLKPVVKHILGLVGKQGSATELGLQTLGEIAVAVGRKEVAPFMGQFMQVIAPLVKVELVRGGRSFLPFPGALLCVGKLAQAAGDGFVPFLLERGMLNRIFEVGLFPELVSAMSSIHKSCPSLADQIEKHLLDLLSLVLYDAPFRALGVPPSEALTGQQEPLFAKRIRQHTSEGGPALKMIALNTLRTFPFSGPLVHLAEKLLRYLDSKSQKLKLEAITASLHLLKSDSSQVPKLAASISHRVVSRVLLLGTTDTDDTIRHVCIQCLAESPIFDAYVNHPDNMKLLLVLSYDESHDIRRGAIQLLGRMERCSPGFVRPALRKMMIELIQTLDLDRTSPAELAQSARLMAAFVNAVPADLVRPYVPVLFRGVSGKLTHQDPRISTAMLQVVGELAISSGTAVGKDLAPILPLLIQMVHRQLATSASRDVVYRTLGQVCQGGGFVSDPLVQYPSLLTILLQDIRTDPDPCTRDEVLRLLGILGALDPELYNEKRQETSKEQAKADFSEVQFTSNKVSPEFYSRVAIMALKEILGDASAPMLQKTAVQALVTIFRSLGPRKTISYLRDVMPLILSLLRSSDTAVHDFVLQELGAFVMQTGLYMGPYMDEIFSLLFPMWGTSNFPMVIALIQQIARAFGDEFGHQMPRVFPRLLSVLKDSEAPVSHRLATLGLLGDVKFCLLSYSHFLIPVIVTMMREPALSRAAIQTLSGLYNHLELGVFVATLVRALLRVMEDQVDLQSLALEALGGLCEHMGADFAPMVPMIDDSLRAFGLNAPEYHKVVAQSITRTRTQLDFRGRSSSSSLLISSQQGLGNTYDQAATASQQQQQQQQHRQVGVTGGDGGGAAGAGVGDDDGDGALEDSPSPASASNRSDSVGDGAGAAALDSPHPLQVNLRTLSTAWISDQVSTPQDWFEWLRRFVISLLVESPSPAFRACLPVAQIHYPLARQLFNVAFASVWRELPVGERQKMVEALQIALEAPSVPPEILQNLLDLIEYMEVEDGLPIDKVKLETLALNSAAYAKALRYAEDNYRASPEGNVERMIGLYTQLRLPDAAIGVLAHARARFQIELDESWMERLQRWDRALVMYEDKLKQDPDNINAVMGKLRCLKALGEWEQLSVAADEVWGKANNNAETLARIAPFAAAAAHNIQKWTLMEKYLDAIPLDDEDGNFYRAICAISRHRWDLAKDFIVAAREQADIEMTALAAESYMRAYSAAIRLQQLVELEEIVAVRNLEQAAVAPASVQAARQAVAERWNTRFENMARQPDFMRRILGVRALLFSALEQSKCWLLYASVAARAGRVRSNRRAIAVLLGIPAWDSPGALEVSNLANEDDPAKARCLVGAFKYLWRNGRNQEAVANLEFLARKLASRRSRSKDPGLSKMYIRLAGWQRSLTALGTPPDETALQRVAESCRMATHFDSTYKAWHLWSLTNFELIQYYERCGSDKVRPFLCPAIQGFFEAIGLAESTLLCFPDVLRVLTLWFRHASLPEVEESLREGFRRVSTDTWIVVIPQLIARMHSPQSVVRRLVHELLVQLAALHPQALVYPLAVASKSTTPARRTAALAVLTRMKLHSPTLVEQALMVGQELIGASVVLHEQWLEGLEDAAGLFYTSENIPAFLKRLAPLHTELTQCKFQTRHQVAFRQDYGADLEEALALCENYKQSRDIVDLNDAWECYARVYYKLKKRIPKLRKLSLQHVSPQLYAARDMELAVPGTYSPKAPIIRIQSFDNQLRVYNTKQRPRKLNIVGSDGNSYVFILKAHEDLRQDERVMQFFALANSLLSKRIETKALTIEMYPIVPLSTNSGLIGFVPHSDTLHQLITDYRVSAGIPLDIEFQMLYQHVEKSWANYHLLTTLQKVHVYRHICKNTSGQEMAKVMWIRAGSSERWLDNRATFTNSFAVMSIVGYILGLGDRHPNNIVIDRTTGKLIHIDFGDCFETSIDRKKFPETVPFRCTRMLINCMEVAGVDGTFRVVCERVMEVLRLNRDSLMAVLEAFVHDPLFSWRLMTQEPSAAALVAKGAKKSYGRPSGGAVGGGGAGAGGGEKAAPGAKDSSNSSRRKRTDSTAQLYHGLSPTSPLSSDSYSSGHEEGSLVGSSVLGSRATSVAGGGSPLRENEQEEVAAQLPNNRAVQVIDRIERKLNGRDFLQDEVLDHKTQVSRLIDEATSETNLAQLFHGWCCWW